MRKQYCAFMGLFVISLSSNIFASTPAKECKKLFEDAAYTRAIQSCNRAADSGDSESQTLLGEIYDQTGDSKQTAYWWSKAARSGYQPARNLLALKYFYGGTVLGKEKGWKQDYKKSFSLWEDDAKNDIASSQFMIGVMYQKGYGVEKSLADAWFWLKVSLENGYKLSTDVLIEISHNISVEEKKVGQDKLDQYHKKKSKI